MTEKDESKVALFDLDGTLADYAGQLAEDFNKIRHPSEPEYSRNDFGQHNAEPDWMYQRRSFITERGEWWASLPLWPPGFSVLSAAQFVGFRIMVLTQGPGKKPEAWSGKIEWCKKHMPGVDVTITRDKSLVYGRVLVDDWPDYVTGWLANRPRGLVVMPQHPWNESFSHPNVLHYNKNQPEILEALQKAFDR